MGGDGLGGHHGLVEVDYPEASLHHHLQLLSHELSLSSNPPLSISIIDLGDPYLLLPDVVALVDGAVLGHRNLSVWVDVEELSSALRDCHAYLLQVGLSTDDPVDLLL